VTIGFSAKQLIRGEPNVSYICSRYYRAPELIFGATDYTSQIGNYVCSHPRKLAFSRIFILVHKFISCYISWEFFSLFCLLFKYYLFNKSIVMAVLI